MKQIVKHWRVLAMSSLALALAILALSMGWGAKANPVYAAPQTAAGNPTITLTSPATGAVISGNSITVGVAPQNFTFSCALVGKPDVPGVGHWHLHVDGNLVDFECGTAHLLSLAALTPGAHTLTAVLSTNGHMELTNPEASVTIPFTYQPTLPTIQVQAPTVVDQNSQFKVHVNWTNFTTSEDFFGKELIPGYGHWHLYIDGYKTDAMTEMMHMVDMGTANTDTLNTTGLTPGPHTVWARLVDNHHMPLSMDGLPDIVSAPVTFVVQ